MLAESVFDRFQSNPFGCLLFERIINSLFAAKAKEYIFIVVHDENLDYVRVNVSSLQTIYTKQFAVDTIFLYII